MSESQNRVDFQFRTGGVGNGVLAKLSGVVDGKKAKRGVTIKNIDEQNVSVLLVTSTDKATPGAAADPNACYKVRPGESVELEISEPDAVLVAGEGMGVDYTWFSR